MTKSRILEFIEYLSMGLSIWGVLAAWISYDYAYAIIPLTISVALNLASQQRLRKLQQRQENSIGELVQVDPELSVTQQQVEKIRNLQQQDVEAINLRLSQFDSVQKQIGQIQQTHKILRSR